MRVPLSPPSLTPKALIFQGFFFTPTRVVRLYGAVWGYGSATFQQLFRLLKKVVRFRVFAYPPRVGVYGTRENRRLPAGAPWRVVLLSVDARTGVRRPRIPIILFFSSGAPCAIPLAPETIPYDSSCDVGSVSVCSGPIRLQIAGVSPARITAQAATGAVQW